MGQGAQQGRVVEPQRAQQQARQCSRTLTATTPPSRPCQSSARSQSARSWQQPCLGQQLPRPHSPAQGQGQHHCTPQSAHRVRMVRSR